MLQSLRGIRLVLKMGKGQSKSVLYDVIMALTHLAVTDNALERDVFQMTFMVGKTHQKWSMGPPQKSLKHDIYWMTIR